MPSQGDFLSISGKVKELRKALGGISQAELARRLGITPNAVAAWEQGVREPDEINCLRLSHLTDGPLSQFFASRAGLQQQAVGVKAVAPSAGPSLEQLQLTMS